MKVVTWPTFAFAFEHAVETVGGTGETTGGGGATGAGGAGGGGVTGAGAGVDTGGGVGVAAGGGAGVAAVGEAVGLGLTSPPPPHALSSAVRAVSVVKAVNAKTAER